ncbi:hypothetical protein DL96DRAFT_1821296 [Flagelloscypha sp. PMI_526]|nr:hypothetical protein DL96DRAFT_1821296 [Flagelloscypha sp. PMI_526]
MLIYDHFLTFGPSFIFSSAGFYNEFGTDDEIQYIWTPPWNKNTFFFSLNRYVGLFVNILTLFFTHWTTKTFGQCHQVYLLRQISLILVQGITCLILSLRTYALYLYSKRIMWGLLIYFAALIGVVTWSMTGQSGVEEGTIHHDTDACHVSMDNPSAARLAICWEALFTFDATIFILTMCKTWRTRHSIVSVKSVSFLRIFVRDGAIYFLLMALANLANILTFYFAPPFLRGRLSTFASCLAITLVSRMMLNLYHAPIEGAVDPTLTAMSFKDPEAGGDSDESLVASLSLKMELADVWLDGSATPQKGSILKLKRSENPGVI